MEALISSLYTSVSLYHAVRHEGTEDLFSGVVYACIAASYLVIYHQHKMSRQKQAEEKAKADGNKAAEAKAEEPNAEEKAEEAKD